LIEVDVTDYNDLAYKHINALPPYKKAGVQEDDLLQAAHLGIYLASLAYEEGKAGEGGFLTFCYWYIQREITSLTCKQIQVDGEKKLRSIVKERLFDDIETTKYDSYEESISFDDFKESDLFVDEFLKSLPLTGHKKDFFINMYQNDESYATKEYMTTTGHSRARAKQVKETVKALAARHLGKLERD